MTHRAVGFGPGFPRAWLLPIGALTILLGVAASGRLSRAIVADLIAWWPVWLGLVIVAYLLRDRRVGTFRVSGLVPLAALFFVVLFAWGHLAGWALMPSASQKLVGPEADQYASAGLVAGIDGQIEISSGSNWLYQVEPIKRGGGIGIPDATERVAGDTVVVDLVEPADPVLYTYAGWAIGLSPNPTWDLDFDGAIDADLTDVRLSGVRLAGAGSVLLGAATTETPVTVAGSFEVVIPDGSAARVIGTATVPATWTTTDDGAVSPGGADGWVITVVGDATLTVREG